MAEPSGIHTPERCRKLSTIRIVVVGMIVGCTTSLTTNLALPITTSSTGTDSYMFRRIIRTTSFEVMQGSKVIVRGQSLSATYPWTEAARHGMLEAMWPCVDFSRVSKSTANRSAGAGVG